MKARASQSATPSGSEVIPRRAAQVLEFEAGSLYRLGDAPVSVVRAMTPGRLLVRHLIDSRTEVVEAAGLKPLPTPDVPGGVERQTAADDHSDAAWSRAREEERLIGPLLGNSDRQARLKVVHTLGLSDRQIRRKLKRYAALRSIDAFLPLRRGPLPGATTVHPTSSVSCARRSAQRSS